MRRMADAGLRGVDFLILNTDIQALRAFRTIPTFAIGPAATNGMGSGGRPDIGRRAMRESRGAGLQPAPRLRYGVHCRRDLAEEQAPEPPR